MMSYYNIDSQQMSYYIQTDNSSYKQQQLYIEQQQLYTDNNNSLYYINSLNDALKLSIFQIQNYAKLINSNFTFFL